VFIDTVQATMMMMNLMASFREEGPTLSLNQRSNTWIDDDDDDIE